MNDIRNFYRINERIASSGQPGADQFLNIAAQGYSAVINLAMPTSDFAIVNEGEIVTSLGMTYVHIPVSWEDPKMADLMLFFAIMHALNDKKIWLHCALNKRVSCFIYLYKMCVLQLPESESIFPMSDIWQPSGAWVELINAAKAKLFRRG